MSIKPAPKARKRNRPSELESVNNGVPNSIFQQNDSFDIFQSPSKKPKTLIKPIAKTTSSTTNAFNIKPPATSVPVSSPKTKPTPKSPRRGKTTASPKATPPTSSPNKLRRSSQPKSTPTKRSTPKSQSSGNVSHSPTAVAIQKDPRAALVAAFSAPQFTSSPFQSAMSPPRISALPHNTQTASKFAQSGSNSSNSMITSLNGGPSPISHARHPNAHSSATVPTSRWKPNEYSRSTMTNTNANSRNRMPTCGPPLASEGRSQSAPSKTRGVNASVMYPVPESIETLDMMRNCSLSLEATSGDVPTWGLPMVVVDILKKRGFTKLHEWQRECLTTTGILDGESLVYSLPTSGGKTFVADVVMLREVFVHRKVAIFVLPYVAIVMEKVKSLKEFAKRLNFTVEGYFQNNGRLPLPKNVATLCICTIEKANVLVNSLIEEGRLGEVGLVVFDELHMLGDPSRGYLLEILGTKIKYASKSSIQMIGMSATLPNLEALAKWLGGKAYCREFRPVKLVEYVFCASEMLTTKVVGNDPSDKAKRGYYAPRYIGELGHSIQDQSYRHHFVFEIARQLMPHKSTLIFCHSRAITVKLAKELAQLLSLNPPSYESEDLNVRWAADTSDVTARHLEFVQEMSKDKWAQKLGTILDERKLLVKKIQTMTPSRTIDKSLEECLLQGVAWHNSDMGSTERELIESGFRSKIISIICCTSTLAAGVNLPARRVVLMSDKMGPKELSVGEYRQMVGRAGRAGIDELGESFLIHLPDRRSSGLSSASAHLNAIKLLASPLKAVESPLGSSESDAYFKYMRKARIDLYRRSKTSPIDSPPTFLVQGGVNCIDPHQPVFSLFCVDEPSTSAHMSDTQVPSSHKANKPLYPSGCGIDRLLIDAIGGRSAVTLRECIEFVKCSFLAATKKHGKIPELVATSINFLTIIGFIDWVSPEEAKRRQDNDPDYDGDANFQQQLKGRPRSTLRDYLQVVAEEAKLIEAEEAEEAEDMEITTGKHLPNLPNLPNLPDHSHHHKTPKPKTGVSTTLSSSSSTLHRQLALQQHILHQQRTYCKGKVLVVSTFGAATYRTPFGIDQAIYLREELEKSLDRLSLRSDINLCWLVAPFNARTLPSNIEAWCHLLQPSTQKHSHAYLKADESSLATRVGASWELLNAFLPDQNEDRDDNKPPTVPYKIFECPSWQPTQRFIVAMLLNDIVNETPTTTVSEKYSVSAGEIEALMTNASNQAGQLTGFCKRMEWWHLEALFKIFALRVGLGVKEDILPLMKIKGVKSARARVLYQAGYRSVRSVALAQPHELSKVLSRKHQDLSATKLATSIIASAQKFLDSAADELRVTARALKDPSPTPDISNGGRKGNKRRRDGSSMDVDVPPIGGPEDDEETRRREMELVQDWWDYDPNLEDEDDDDERAAIEMELLEGFL